MGEEIYHYLAGLGRQRADGIIINIKNPATVSATKLGGFTNFCGEKIKNLKVEAQKPKLKAAGSAQSKSAKAKKSQRKTRSSFKPKKKMIKK